MTKRKRKNKPRRTAGYWADRHARAAAYRQHREAEERAAEAERRRQVLIARAEAVTPLPYDNTGRPAVLETGSNR